ncbi:MAG: hypothetical protein KDK70_09045 [Myxococcales bacterium]|nr:hypothetical protein [Myxococcales bacterium]
MKRVLRAWADARRRSLTLAVVLLGAAISTPLAYMRCTGGLGLDLLYTWPAVLALTTPAVALLRDLQRTESPPPLAARLPTRARDGVRSRRRGATRSLHAARLSAKRRDRADRRA